MIESGMSKYSRYTNPYDISFDDDTLPATRLSPNDTVGAYTYMFVREPYGRLLSFYVDKLMASNPYYWKAVGVNAAKLRSRSNTFVGFGHDVTFQEFIKYAIQTMVSGKNVDPHWVEMERNCRGCEIKYDYIGKMETFAQNADEILLKLGLNTTREFLKQDGGLEGDFDAIKDSVIQPYVYEIKYKHCLSFQKAVERAWEKLQIRGLIASGPAPSNLTSKTSSWKDLFDLAKTSRFSASKSERKQLKRDLQKKYWAQINVEDLYKIKRLYAKDFKLFVYDDHPEIVFQGRTLLTK